MRIPRKNYEKLMVAIVRAFDPANLEQMVKFQLDEDLDSIVGEGSLSKRTFELIQWLDRRDRVDELYAAAVAKRPTNRDLAALATVEPEAEWQHRLDLVPSLWKAKWRETNGKLITETMKIDSWIGENEFEGFGLSEHGTESDPRIYDYSFNGSIEPTGVIILEYRAERYPIEGRKNVGVAILAIKNEKKLAGYFSGYKDKRSREQLEKDYITHPEESVESSKFYIPFGSMSYYGGTVEMFWGGRGTARS